MMKLREAAGMADKMLETYRNPSLTRLSRHETSSSTHMRSSLLTGLLVLLVAVGCSSSSEADPAAAKRPLDPTVPQYGKTYDEWGATWWKAFVELPTPLDKCESPLSDPTGEKCALGQDPNAPVFFLHGTQGGKVVRDKCPVPTGKALFFPVLNNIGTNALNPTKPITPQEMRDAQAAFLRSVKVESLVVTVDDVAVTDLARFRGAPTKFEFVLPGPGNQFSCEGGPQISGPSGESYSSGYWIMLPPLPKGPHQIYFAGSTTEGFTLDVTYKFELK
jgi:hypothetical protein